MLLHLPSKQILFSCLLTSFEYNAPLNDSETLAWVVSNLDVDFIFGVLQPNPKHLARCLQPYIVNEIVISKHRISVPCMESQLD